MQRADTLPRDLRSAAIWGQAATAFLVATIAVVLFHLVSGEIALRSVAERPSRSSFRRIRFFAAHDHYQVTLIVSLVAIIVSAAVFLRWVYCTYLVERRYSDARWPPRDIAIGLGIPPISLFFGHRALRETIKTVGRRRSSAEASRHIDIWFGLVVVSLLTTWLQLRSDPRVFSVSPGTIDGFIAASLVRLVALCYSIWLIKRVRADQSSTLRKELATPMS